MSETIYNVLFLCTGNSARSILAEALLKEMGNGRFNSFSAGSKPKGKVHPIALQVLECEKYNVAEYSSKSWDEFEGEGAPNLDFVITLCGNAEKETCPIWNGNQPIRAHWGLPDPAACEGSDEIKIAAFKETIKQLRTRLNKFISLSLDVDDKQSLQKNINDIGNT